MRLLLDTHALIWWYLDQPELSAPARVAIADGANDVLVSAASTFELATKHRSGRLPGVAALVDGLSGYLAQQRFAELPISPDHGLRAGTLAGAHKDPFDRLLAAQALADGLTLVSVDAALDQFGVHRLW